MIIKIKETIVTNVLINVEMKNLFKPPDMLLTNNCSVVV